MIFLLLAGSYFYLNKTLPTGEKGAAADQLANQMLEAMDYEAYKELNYIEWTFSSLAEKDTINAEEQRLVHSFW